MRHVSEQPEMRQHPRIRRVAKWAGLVLCGVLAALWLFSIFFSLRFKAVQEEKLLTRHFGEAYTRYKSRVPALIPLVW